MRHFFFWFLFLLPIFGMAQNDSCHLRVSLLTASPGEDLYSTFGHSALRVTDTVSHTDIVYNYGTFNFEEPGFYIKFTRGKLLYFLSRDYYESFVENYRLENRTITEQVLNLTCEQKMLVNAMLQENLLPQNLYYQYDFLFDNCTTRLRDLIASATQSKVSIPPVLSRPTTFRELIHEYLNRGDKQWSKLGIDLLLGSKTDGIMTPKETMFLPDYLMKSYDEAQINHQPFVTTKRELIDVTGSDKTINYLLHPVVIFSILFLIIFLLSFSTKTSIQNALLSFDRFLFFVIGLLGILFLFMWTGTDHIMCENNYNLLWAWPTHLFAAFYIGSNLRWLKIYQIIFGIVLLAIIGFWWWMPQQFNPSLIPIFAICIFRIWIKIYRNR